MIEKPIRHLQRYKDIIVAISRNGLGFLLKQLGLHDLKIIPKRLYKPKNPKIVEKTLGERIRLILEELGPTFIKVGQIASTRPDLFSDEIIAELEKLQTDVPPFPYKNVREIIESELGLPIEEIFASFGEEPVAAASIGQVHRAVLKTGEEVAVKIQRPNIKEKIATDFEILKEMATLAELRMDWAVRYRVRDVVKEFAVMIKDELDYVLEAQSTNRIRDQFAGDSNVMIPTIYEDVSTSKVLVMEFAEGVKLSDVIEGEYLEYDHKKIARHIAEVTFQQVLIDGFFHADPHPGNILIQPDNKIVLLDFGMVGRLTAEMREQFGILLLALMSEDTKRIVSSLLDMGITPPEIDRGKLTSDVDLLMDKYYQQKLSKISLSDAIRDLFKVAQKHQIKLSPEYSTLGKTMLTLEGTISQLDPELSIVDVAKTYGQKFLRERFKPKRMFRQVADQLRNYGELFEALPRHVKKLTTVVKEDRLQIDLKIPDLNIILKKMDRISNQLSFALVLLAFSIIMVGLIIGSAVAGQSSVLWSLPAIEIGSFVAGFMFLWLLFSIFRSGRF